MSVGSAIRPFAIAAILLCGFIQYVASCDDKLDCFNDATNHENDWVKCDLCVCNNFDDYTDDSEACSASDEKLYNCW
jgi:hypothetical protein